ncbi:MAG: hypothetical protein ACE5WD_14360, partial [Candidatus Aminicenantia bacterium]
MLAESGSKSGAKNWGHIPEINLNDIVVVNNDYDKLKSIFNSPPCCGTYYLFNGSGAVVDTGKNNIGYERGVKVFLKQLIKNEYFSISDFIMANENIKNISWFNHVAKILEKEDNDYFIISLFTSYCGSCKSKLIIDFLKEIYNKNHESVYILVILNGDFYNLDDIKSLQSQSRVNFPIIIADLTLTQKWTSLIHEFREDYLKNIVFIMNKSGKILRILDGSCNCFKDFFNFVRSLI